MFEFTIRKVTFTFCFLSLLLCNVRSWKTCNDTFCGTLRKSPEGYPRYTLNISTVQIVKDSLTGKLTNHDGSHTLQLSYSYIGLPNITRLEISDESKKPQGVSFLPGTTGKNQLRFLRQTASSVTIENGNARSIIYSDPFKIENYFNNKLVSVINKNDRMVVQVNSSGDVVALDVSFPGAVQVYGLPLRADNLPLRTTSNSDPYRLFNVNRGQYKVKSIDSLHSSVASLFAHSQNQTSGLFWNSPAQIWVDIAHGTNGIDTFFMAETYSLQVTFFHGPTMEEAVKQNSFIKGNFNGPPVYFSLGYHQSRNSYASENEVLDVVNQFDANNLPLESVWLDTNYMDQGKCFTWNSINFPNPTALQDQLAKKNRTLIITIGPDIKTENGYFVHDQASAKRFYVQNPNGSDYVGGCSAGNCSYLNHFDYNTSEYYVSLFSLATFKAKNLHVLLESTEPTVLGNEQQENTFPPELIHNIEGLPHAHRELHNVYSDYDVLVTHNGLFARNLNGIPPSEVFKAERPFVTTRSHSAYAMNYASTFTGNNNASWDHLQISFPMCLSESLVGIRSCGANVGGFSGIPSDELYQRWYQAGAWLPFYRAHFAADVPRREPYMYVESIKTRVRKALQQRYAHLPVWYTLYWESVYTFSAIIRPLFYNYPNDAATFTIDQQILVGANILVAPVMKPGVIMTSVYLPGGESEIWYNINDNYKAFRGTGLKVLNINMDSVPVFYRGGSIIARKDTPRLTTQAAVNDPYTLYICLDINNKAEGTLYVDDYKTHSYLNLEYLYIGFVFEDNSLTSFKLIESADYDGAAPITDIVVVNPPANILKVYLNEERLDSQSGISVSYSENGNFMKVRNLSLNLRESFKLTLL
ncbi:hypothetical protein ILUMI_11754 [Ignelater luminosus]|uniref:Glucosidase II subunit alpha n=1 Tax=Ignelater luminosus TaxID=2038154 RepID=A0A8K0GCF4_IGNLU|nr:hypothetical protein ILUMI_11754 [Ignelater luminosus]